MERGAFSQPALIEENLEKEKMWAQRIEQMKDYLEKEVNFVLISEIISDILKRVFPEAKQETLSAFLKQVSQPNIEITYEDPAEEEESVEKITFGRAGGGKLYFNVRPFFMSGSLDTVAVLHFAIHESLHLASSTFESIEGYSLHSGISAIEERNGLETKPFNSLNEGLTEFITDSIYSEYLARSGEMKMDRYEAKDTASAISYGSVGTTVIYRNERLDVLEFIDALEEMTEFSRDQIIRSLVAEYFMGEGLERSELRTFYEQNREIKDIIKRQKRNLVSGYTQKSHDFLVEELPYTERDFIKALFGRDVVGAYNEKLRETI